MVGAHRQLAFIADDFLVVGEDGVDVDTVLVLFMSSSRDSSCRSMVRCFAGCCTNVIFSSDMFLKILV